uniref:START domain-containing protein n=1 Tax=Anopheles epiroticus TaxID=199890 RepID=A0A182PAV4_9DIPT
MQMSCPPPLKPRDFVLQRSWLDTGPQGEQMLLSRSVPHKDYPPKKGYVRAMSYITGFVLRTNENSKTGCILKYVAHCDPQGTLPPWLVNKVTHTLGPRMVKDLKKAALGYASWKLTQPHLRKPWRYPEEIRCPRISIDDCLDTVTVPLALPPATTKASPKSAPATQAIPIAQQPATQRKLPQLKTQTNGRVLPILHKKAQSTPASPVVEEAKFPKRDELKELLEEKRKDDKKKQKDAKEPKAKDSKESLKSSKELEKEAKAAAKESKKLSKAAAKEAAAAESALAKKEKKEKGLTKRRSLLNLKF